MVAILLVHLPIFMVQLESVSKKKHEKISVPTSSEIRAGLEKAAIVTTTIVEGNNFTVVDTEALKKYITHIVGLGSGRSIKDTEDLLVSLMSSVPEKVLSQEQFAAGDLNPKNLFYAPETVQAATSIIKIKTSQFHLLPTEVLEKLRMRARFPLKSGEDISCLEIATAVAVFHPAYGDGFRDENGTLFMKTAETREYKRFSGPALSEWGIHKNYFLFEEDMHGGRESDRSMRQGLVAELPHLVEKGLVVPNQDVRQHTLGTAQVEERNFEHVGVTASGSRTIGGVQHHIGKDLFNKEIPIRITTLSKGMGCVIDDSKGFPRIIRVFNIIKKENASLVKNGTSGFLHRAGKDLTQPRDFSPQSFGLAPLPGETKVAFEERCEAVDRGLAYLLLVTAREHPEVSALLRSESPTFLSGLAKTAYWLDKEDKKKTFDTFAENFGATGLRTFLATAYDPNASEYIFAIARRFPEETAHRVFAKFSEFVDAAALVERTLEVTGSLLSPHILREYVQKHLLDKAVALLRTMGTESKLLTEESVERELAALRAEATKLVSTKRMLKSSGVPNPETLLGVQIRSLPASELNKYPRIHAQIEEFLHRNYKDSAHRPYTYPKPFRESIAQGARGLSQKNETILYLATKHNEIMHDDDVLACMRFDIERGTSGEVEHLYFGSFAADPAYAGGAFGEDLLRTAFREVEEKYPRVPIHAHCDPRADITQKYIEMGFVASEVAIYEGVPSFNIALNRYHNNHALGTKLLSKEKIVARTKNGESTDMVQYVSFDHPPTADDFAQYLDAHKTPHAPRRSPVVLTRFFKEEGMYYAVFERAPATSDISGVTAHR